MTINLELAEKAKELVSEVFGKYNDKVNEKLKNINFAITSSTSKFDRNNTVLISPRALNDLSVYVHELLHVVSTSTSFNKQYIGFHKTHSRKIGEDMYVQTSFGYAINEGATECFTRDVIYGKFVKANADSTYNFCSSIYKNLERVLTTSAARVLYANGNVERFIEAVATSAHTKPDNVLKLILNLDAFFDTNRFFNVYMSNPYSADATKLLANAYTYLSIILSDYQKANGKKFDFWTDVDRYYLTQQELPMFAEVAKMIDINNFKDNSVASVKMYENFAMHILGEQYNKKTCNLGILPDEIKCGEFYNFFMLGTNLCDKNGISYDIKTKDEQALLTRKIYNPKFNALKVDKYLPQNIATMLSARYAIRANTATSDYYMEQCMQDEKFREYIQASDPDYFDAMCDLIKSKQELNQSQNDDLDKNL